MIKNIKNYYTITGFSEFIAALFSVPKIIAFYKLTNFSLTMGEDAVEDLFYYCKYALKNNFPISNIQDTVSHDLNKCEKKFFSQKTTGFKKIYLGGAN